MINEEPTMPKHSTETVTSNQQKNPNETSGFHVEGHIKIFDPKTN